MLIRQKENAMADQREEREGFESVSVDRIVQYIPTKYDASQEFGFGDNV